MNTLIHELIHRHLQGALTDDERIRLEEWKNASASNAALFAQLTDKDWLTEELQEMERRYDKAARWEKIREQAFPQRKVFRLRRWTAAAGFLLLLSAGGGLYWFISRAKPLPAQAERFRNDVPPGKEGAILTLADGSQVLLDDTPDGKLVSQYNVAVSVQDGQLAYTTASRPKELMFNKLSTPRGRSFRLQLADGTTVWLNAGSSISFPMAFPDSAREVSITGEAYLEIAKSQTPFRVKTNGMEVSVLGTHFNISAYEEDGLWATTLLEGAVKVNGLLLQPGQQAELNRKSNQLQSTKADPEAVLAWKNNLFWFADEDIREVMKQLERWYDIQVVFENDVDVRFSGTIPRNVNISTILKTLELTNGVKFNVDGKKVTVLKG